MNTEQQQSHLTSDCVGDASKTALAAYSDRVKCTSCNGTGSYGEHGCTDCLGEGLDHAAFVGGIEQALNDAYAEGRKDEREDLQAVFDELRANSALLAALQEIAREDAGGFYAAIANKALAKAGVTP